MDAYERDYTAFRELILEEHRKPGFQPNEQLDGLTYLYLAAINDDLELVDIPLWSGHPEVTGVAQAKAVAATRMAHWISLPRAWRPRPVAAGSSSLRGW